MLVEFASGDSEEGPNVRDAVRAEIGCDVAEISPGSGGWQWQMRFRKRNVQIDVRMEKRAAFPYIIG